MKTYAQNVQYDFKIFFSSISLNIAEFGSLLDMRSYAVQCAFISNMDGTKDWDSLIVNVAYPFLTVVEIVVVFDLCITIQT